MSKKELCVNKIIVPSLLLTAIVLMHPAPAPAASGNESNCSVINVGYGVGAMDLICSSGSINYAFLTGANNLILGPGTCPTLDLDTLKMLVGIALTARASGLFVNVWYTDSCISGAPNIRAITGLEMKGN
jgi:hypothetical protein